MDEHLGTEWPFPVYLWAYEYISADIKTIEGRCPDFSNPQKDYRNIEPGDIAVFTALTEQGKALPHPAIRKEILHVNAYPSFRQMLAVEGLTSLLPQVESIDEGVAVYHSFPGYKEREKITGASAIHLGVTLHEPQTLFGRSLGVVLTHAASHDDNMSFGEAIDALVEVPNVQFFRVNRDKEIGLFAFPMVEDSEIVKLYQISGLSPSQVKFYNVAF